MIKTTYYCDLCGETPLLGPESSNRNEDYNVRIRLNISIERYGKNVTPEMDAHLCENCLRRNLEQFVVYLSSVSKANLIKPETIFSNLIW